MAKNVTQYDLLISCPGDVQSEVEIIKQIVDDFNERYSDTLGISLRARHWKRVPMLSLGKAASSIE